MGVSEAARLALYNRLGEVIGPENAETLMSSLPLQPATELATKDDVAGLRTDMRELRTEMRELRTEMRELRTEMHGIRTEVVRQYRTFFTLTLGSLVALTGIFSVIVSLVT